MKRILIAVFCLVPANFSSADETIDYTEQVAPLLRKYCEACHNAEDREGGFSVESFADFLDDEGDARSPGEFEKDLGNLGA